MKLLLVLCCLLIGSLATKIQSYNGTLHAVWEKSCSSRYKPHSSATMTIDTSKNASSVISLSLSSFTNYDGFTCNFTVINSTTIYVSNDFVPFGNLNDTSFIQDQFVSLTCHNSTENHFSDDTPGAADRGQTMNLTVLNLAQGILVNVEDEPECAVFFGENATSLDLPALTVHEGKSSQCGCSTLCFEGNISIFDHRLISSRYDTGEVFIHFDGSSGSYIHSENKTNITMGCDIDFIPQYPSPIYYIENCYYEREIVLGNYTLVTLLDNGNVIFGDTTDDPCFMGVIAVLFQANLLASLGLLIFTLWTSWLF